MLTVSPSKRRAFTLVELLVVIGIIAVLIAILLPALTRARKQANTTKCASALHQIAYAFTMYSKENRGKYPVVKYDPLPQTFKMSDGTVIDALYWQDYLWKYVSKSEAFSRQALTSTTYDAKIRFQAVKASVFWGCPEWEGAYGTNTSSVDIISFSENGYAYNIFPMYNAKTTVADYNAGQNYRGSIAMDSKENNVQNGSKGYHMFKDWAPSADRCLVIEATLWLLIAGPTDPSSHVVGPQPANANGNKTVANTFGAAGSNNIDRYRHGKLPSQAGDYFADNKGGRVGYNILYADGHVSTANTIAEGYKSIQMRDP